jgi:hypothetical protein
VCRTSCRHGSMKLKLFNFKTVCWTATSYELRATSDELATTTSQHSSSIRSSGVWGTVSTSGSINKALLNSVNARFVWVYNV